MNALAVARAVVFAINISNVIVFDTSDSLHYKPSLMLLLAFMHANSFKALLYASDLFI